MRGIEVIPLVAAGDASPLVGDLGLCLIAAGVLSLAFVKLRIPAIAALLCAGVVLGPAGLQAIHERESIDAIANLGLTLLLFVIGLEVNLASLLSRGRTLVVTGIVQVPLSIALAFAMFYAIGLTGWDLVAGAYPPLYLGVACAFSSTLLVVKYLREHLQIDTTSGALCIGLLIFQDIWVIVFLALQPSFTEPSLVPILLTFVGTALLVLVAVVVARVVLPHAFRLVARSPELVVTVALAWCFGVALFGANLSRLAPVLGVLGEISVSIEMGALIAGATIATSPYAYEVVSRVVHLRDFFVTLFFVGLGMSIPVPDSVGVILLAVIVSVVAIVLRFVLFLPILYWTGLDRRNAVAVSAKLAQVSEFCLVVLYLGTRLGHVTGAHTSVVIFAFVLTALATPSLFALSDRLYLGLRGFMDAIGMRSRGAVQEREAGAPPRLVLLGFHRIASALLADLELHHEDLLQHILVVDFNKAVHEELRKRGVEVVYGDIGNTEVLHHAGVDKAEVIVSTLPDELLKGTNNEQLVRALRELAPKAVIVANSTRAAAVPAIQAAGADYVFRPASEAAYGLLPVVHAALNAELPSYLLALEQVRGAAQHRIEIIR